MFHTLIFYHNSVRWLVLISLLYALYRSYKGYYSKSAFSKTDDSVRHWTATIAHVQLMIGMILYFKSPLIQYFLTHFKVAGKNVEILFFGLIHSSLMLIAIILISIGSAIAKRKESDQEKFKTMIIWFTIALAVIFIAIPWPFSPISHRPYFR